MNTRQVDCQKVIVVRPGALGDTVLTIPILRSIQLKHPNHKIIFFGSRAYSDLLPEEILFNPFDGADASWLYNSEELYGNYLYAYVILRNSAEISVNLRRKGIPKIIECSSIPPETGHIVEALHERLDLPVPERRGVLQTENRSKRLRRIWIHPGSGGPSKCIPFATWEFIIQDLIPGDMEVIITIGEADGFIRDELERSDLTCRSNLHIWNTPTLTELRISLTDCAAYLGVDSGISHLAGAIGLPLGVFYTVTNPEIWSPWVPAKDLEILDLREKRVIDRKLQYHIGDIIERVLINCEK